MFDPLQDRCVSLVHPDFDHVASLKGNTVHMIEHILSLLEDDIAPFKFYYPEYTNLIQHLTEFSMHLQLLGIAGQPDFKKWLKNKRPRLQSKWYQYFTQFPKVNVRLMFQIWRDEMNRKFNLTEKMPLWNQGLDIPSVTWDFVHENFSTKYEK